jgi:uncharacterized protein HemY
MVNQRLNKLLAMLAEQPGDLFLQYALGMEYLGMQDWKAAQESFENVLKANDSYIPAYYQLAQLLIKNGDNSEAIKMLEKGQLLARQKGDTKTANEFRTALDEILFS